MGFDASKQFSAKNDFSVFDSLQLDANHIDYVDHIDHIDYIDYVDYIPTLTG